MCVYVCRIHYVLGLYDRGTNSVRSVALAVWNAVRAVLTASIMYSDCTTGTRTLCGRWLEPYGSPFGRYASHPLCPRTVQPGHELCVVGGLNRMEVRSGGTLRIHYVLGLYNRDTNSVRSVA